MKKTLAALAIAAFAAGSANAAVVYEQDGTKLDIGGRLDVVVGKFNKDERGDLRNNESRIEFHAEQAIANGFKALAHLRVRFNDRGDGESDADRWDDGSSFNNPTANKLWAGFEHDDIGRLTFGKQDTTSDALQMNDRAYIFGGNNNLTDSGDKTVTFRSADWAFAEGHTLGIGADYLFGDSDKDFTSGSGRYSNGAFNTLKNGFGGGLYYTGHFGDLVARINLGATHDNYERTSYNYDEAKKDAWRAASEFTYGPAKFGVEYGQTKFKNAGSTVGKGRYLEVAAKYQYLDNASIYAAWERNQMKGEGAGYNGNFEFLTDVHYDLFVADGQKLTENVFIVGTDYAFHKNVVGYIEYAHNRIKGNGGLDRSGHNGIDTNLNDDTFKDNKYGVGVRIYF